MQFANQVLSFTPGYGAGVETWGAYGTYGGPAGAGTYSPAAVTALDGVSLALGGTENHPGSITMKFATAFGNGAGADLYLYDSFRYDEGFLLQISQDGVNFVTAGRHQGRDWATSSPLNLQGRETHETGIDISGTGLAWAQYVRITVAGISITGHPQGYDLDAIKAVHDANAAPVIAGTGTLTLGADDHGATLTAAAFSASDTGTATSALRYTLSDAPDAGTLLLDGVALAQGVSFGQAEIDAGRISYRAGTGAEAADGFAITVSDAEGASTTGRVAVTLPAFDNVQAMAQWGGYWGTNGRDRLQGTDGAETMTGGNGSDVILGHGGNDSIHAGEGNDHVLGGAGNDFITGDGGHDRIDGGAGTDTIYAGDGNDTLTGGAGDGDILSGGSGDDLYVFSRGDGRDEIQGLNAWENDRVDLRDFAGVLGGVDSWAALKASGRVQSPQWGGDTVIDLGEGDVLTIRWVNAAQLNEGDFLFG